MTASNDYPFLRQVKSPITDDQLSPLDPRCRCVQFSAPLTETDHIKLAKFLAAYPNVPLRIYGHYSDPLPKHYPFVSGFQVDVFLLESTEGIERLPDSLEFFGFGQTKSRNLSLNFLRRFSRFARDATSAQCEVCSIVVQLASFVLVSVADDRLPLARKPVITDLTLTTGPQISAIRRSASRPQPRQPSKTAEYAKYAETSIRTRTKNRRKTKHFPELLID